MWVFSIKSEYKIWKIIFSMHGRNQIHHAFGVMDEIHEMLPWRGFCRVTEASSVSHPSRQRRDGFDFFHAWKKYIFMSEIHFLPLKSHNRYECMPFVTGIVEENKGLFSYVTNKFDYRKMILKKTFLRLVSPGMMCE